LDWSGFGLTTSTGLGSSCAATGGGGARAGAVSAVEVMT
jgi:hypothetical protein